MRHAILLRRHGGATVEPKNPMHLRVRIHCSNPTTLLDLAFGLTPLSMRQIGAVMAPLSPGK
jgi:hypothetical protein